ncbi:MAG TPA: isoprenylcysteine carboxylmethyltransferase family protein [Candidatus Paceibacterota bacterium]|nr:isoprenylcysteine carboxylmethyltransferase family protein [Candidatus Paceibacterota bacterium]
MKELPDLIRSKPWQWIANISMSLLWASFAYRHIMGYLEYDQPAFLIYCASETFIAILFLIRNEVQTLSAKISDWAIALLATFAGMLLTPSPTILWEGGVWIVVLATILQFASVLSLQRSFGIIPANRGVRTGGLYRVVRHPMYLSYMVYYVGYLLVSASSWNVAIFLVAMTAMLIRLTLEEEHLSSDATYAEYRTRVKWRLIPFVF